MRYDYGMHDIGTLLSPWGRTSRTHYRLIVLFSAFVFFAAWSTKDIVTPAVLAAVILVTQLIDLIATVRRLHDAGRSRWLLALCFFPASITWDLFSVPFGGSAWHFLDISAVIRFIPVIIGLLASSTSSPVNSVAQPRHLARDGAGWHLG